MANYLSYALIPLMATLLVTAQAVWGSAIKQQHLLEGSWRTIATNLITSPRIWLGGFIYICATGVYFLLLSKVKFFSVQVAMTAVSIILSTILSVVFFKEALTIVNIMGMLLVLLGLTLVLAH